MRAGMDFLFLFFHFKANDLWKANLVIRMCTLFNKQKHNRTYTLVQLFQKIILLWKLHSKSSCFKHLKGLLLNEHDVWHISESIMVYDNIHIVLLLWSYLQSFRIKVWPLCTCQHHPGQEMTPEITSELIGCFYGRSHVFFSLWKRLTLATEVRFVPLHAVEEKLY